VQPAASRFTDYALLARICKSTAGVQVFVKYEVLTALTMLIIASRDVITCIRVDKDQSTRRLIPENDNLNLCVSLYRPNLV
jgi:hypothetical protein